MTLDIDKKFICAEDELPRYVELVKNELIQKRPFGLLLDAEMGAGKTTFTRELLYQLGINRDLPIVSPTFTFMNEYHISDQWFAHLDLYRLEGQFSLEEFGVFDARKYQGLIIEWPSFSEKTNELTLTHILNIEYHGDEKRSYSFKKLA